MNVYHELEITPEELERWQRAAAASGTTVEQWVRNVVNEVADQALWIEELPPNQSQSTTPPNDRSSPYG